MVAPKNLKTHIKMYMEAFRRLVSNTFRPFTPDDLWRTLGGRVRSRGDTALTSSFPLFDGYMRAGYPNWATKYFIDALLLQHRLGHPARQ